MLPYTFIGPGGFWFFLQPQLLPSGGHYRKTAGLRLFCIDFILSDLLKDVDVLFACGPDLNSSEHL